MIRAVLATEEDETRKKRKACRESKERLRTQNVLVLRVKMLLRVYQAKQGVPGDSDRGGCGEPCGEGR